MTSEGWKTVEIDSWGTLLREVEDLKRHSGSVLFRGQSDADWPLTPSLKRVSSSFAVARQNEIDAYNIFRSRAHSFLSPNLFSVLTRHYNLLLWWAVMRHHGAPTRILDWTRSPFVALYFACESGERSGCVWCVVDEEVRRGMRSKYTSYADFNDFMATIVSVDDEDGINMHFYDESAPAYIMFADTNFLTDRMDRQQGLFSFCNHPHVDHDAAIQAPLTLTLHKSGLERVLAVKPPCEARR